MWEIVVGYASAVCGLVQMLVSGGCGGDEHSESGQGPSLLNSGSMREELSIMLKCTLGSRIRQQK